MDGVSTLGQLDNRRLEVTQVGKVPRQEQYLH
jgi:hypothetical protein